jgi:uncharacterized protein YjbI with pentapeptide repeats
MDLRSMNQFSMDFRSMDFRSMDFRSMNYHRAKIKGCNLSKFFKNRSLINTFM